MRSHLEQLAAQAGHPLDVRRIPGPDWIEASIQGFAGDERPMARVIAGTLAPARVLTAEAAAAEFTAALEPARQEIMAHARALRERAGKPDADARRLADEVSSLRAEMDRLRDPAGALTMLEVVRDAGGRIGVLARLDEPARERAHAILEAAARGPVSDVAPAPGLNAGRTDAHKRKHPATEVLDALRPAQPDTPAPWNRELTPLGERLAAYTRQQEDQRAAEAAPAPPAKPAPDPDDTPQPRRRPGRDPGPGF